MHWRQVKQRLVPHEVRTGSHRSLRGGRLGRVLQDSAKDREEKEQASIQRDFAVVVLTIGLCRLWFRGFLRLLLWLSGTYGITSEAQGACAV